MLFDPRAHEPLLEARWDQAAIEAEIRAIARDAEDGLRGREWWPIHPLDAEPGDPERFHGVYLGAAGMLWGLDRLARAGLHEPRHDYGRLAAGRARGLPAPPEFGEQPSLWIGLGGIALVAWLLAPTPALADRLAALCAADVEPDTLELMWGSPGLLVIADACSSAPASRAGRTAWRRVAERLLGQRGAHVPGLWTQDLYGSRGEILGAGARHGRDRGGARAPPRAAAGDASRPDHAAFAATAVRDGALRELAAVARRRAGAPHRHDPHAVVPRRARHRHARSPRSRARTSSTSCCSRAPS